MTLRHLSHLVALLAFGSTATAISVPLHATPPARLPAAPTSSTSAAPTEQGVHPFLESTFPVAWSKLTPDKIVPDMEEAIRITRARLNAISSVPAGEMTYDNTFRAYDQAIAFIDEAETKFNLLSGVCDSKDIRQAAAQIMPELAAFSSSINKNQALWTALKSASQSIPAASLTPEQARFIEVTLKNFRDGGADMPADIQQRLEAIDRELSDATRQFGNILLDSHAAWQFSTTNPDELAGIDHDTLLRAEKRYAHAHPKARNKGWQFTWDNLTSANLMTKADNENFRRKLWQQSTTAYTGKFNTEPVIKKILKLREEKAKLMGYANYSDFILKDSMAGSGKEGLNFVNDLIEKSKSHYFADLENLRAYKSDKSNSPNAILNPWDTAYWSAKQKESFFHYSEDAVCPYLPADSVLDGLFAIAHKLYCIKISERPTEYIEPGSGAEPTPGSIEVWHPQVRFFDVIDENSSEHIGSFYLDIYPRLTKRNGAWMGTISLARPNNGDSPGQPHLGMIGANVRGPIGGNPALLTPANAKTLFHEFGHMLHLLFCNVETSTLAGTNVPRDFVELPSQIMENWFWEPSLLKEFAKHYKTGQPIPDALLNSMLNVRTHHAAMAFMRQLMLGKMDMALHLNPDILSKTTLDKADRAILGDLLYHKDIALPSVARGSHHLFTYTVGYSSFYFSYKWAEILEADAFSKFQQDGIFNQATAQSFRHNILSKGFSAPPSTLYKNFMGRTPNPDAMLRKYGIIESQPNPRISLTDNTAH